MFDFQSLTIDGLSVAAMTFGIVEALKAFGIKDKGTQLVAVVVGFVLTAMSYALSNDMIPAAAVPWITLVFYGFAGSVAAMGYYKFIDSRVAKRKEE